jgi:hypothetical protein
MACTSQPADLGKANTASPEVRGNPARKVSAPRAKSALGATDARRAMAVHAYPVSRAVGWLPTSWNKRLKAA